MNPQPIFFQPVFHERIWGGKVLRDHFGYDIPSEKTGEAWAISAHPHGESIVRDGRYAGMGLGDLWQEARKEVFGGAKGDRFPLLTKILDANDDLSVQVHPDDAYANRHENGELGKSECWYIIDCNEGAELILGHHARSRDELQQQIATGRWEELLRRVKIKPGDFFYLPSGTVHALGAGTLVLETQQNSDTTYRIYDYDRVDPDGRKRPLHIEKALDVITIPHKDGTGKSKVEAEAGGTITTYVTNTFFSVYKWAIQSEFTRTQDQPFMLASVLAGSGQLLTETGDAYPFTKGDHFLLPYGLGTFTLRGKAELIVSHV